ncbi:conserved hypothetical protein [Burkholderiales bacterium 8X]|nr:conserved hypothetical protein [Burkholderiales bacterium 8X]
MATSRADVPTGPRPAWRGLALLTLAVVAVHVLVAMLLPAGMPPKPSPLVSSFTTRTIEIAPAAPDLPGAPNQAAAPPPGEFAAFDAKATAPSATALPKTSSEPARKAPVEAQRKPRTEPKPRPKPASHPGSEAALPERQSSPPTAAAEMAASPPPAGELPARTEASADAGLAAPLPVDASPAPATAEAGAEPKGSSAPVASASGGAGITAQPGGSGGDGGGNGSREGPVPIRIPGSVRLAFAVTAQQGAAPMQGVFGDLLWLQDGRQYDARLALTFLFKTLRTQHSSGVIGPSGIEPLRFSEKRKSEVASHFVRDQNTVVFSSNAPPVPLLPGAQDRLSVVMQLGALMAGDPAGHAPGGVIAVQTVGTRDGDIWTFRIGEDERIQVPAGDYLARKLSRSARKPFDDTVELWIAPELGYLPIRIKQTQADGDFVDFQLRELLPAGTK